MVFIVQEPTVTDSQVMIFDLASYKVEAAMYTVGVQITKASFQPNDKT